MSFGDEYEVLITAKQIAARIAVLGAEITEHYRDLVSFVSPLKLICVLKGSFIFASDLARAIDLPVIIEFPRASSYGGGTASSGAVAVRRDLEDVITGQHCLLIEDIADTGNTLKALIPSFLRRGPASLEVVALLDKPSRRQVEVELHWVGFEIEDEFVIGYGLDLAELFRNLPDIRIFRGNPDQLRSEASA